MIFLRFNYKFIFKKNIFKAEWILSFCERPCPICKCRCKGSTFATYPYLYLSSRRRPIRAPRGQTIDLIRSDPPQRSANGTAILTGCRLPCEPPRCNLPENRSDYSVKTSRNTYTIYGNCTFQYCSPLGNKARKYEQKRGL